MDLGVRQAVILQWVHHGQTFDKLASSAGLASGWAQTATASPWDKLAGVLMKDQVPSSPSNTLPRHFDNPLGLLGRQMPVLR